jgi:hypothetical protein
LPQTTFNFSELGEDRILRNTTTILEEQETVDSAGGVPLIEKELLKKNKYKSKEKLFIVNRKPHSNVIN